MNQHPWFVRRRIGLGWRPAAWQGWVIIAIAVAVVITAVVVARLSKSPIGIAILVTVVVAYVVIAAVTTHRPAPQPSNVPDVNDTVMSPQLTAPSHAAEQTSTDRAFDGTPALTVEGLTKQFGERVAFTDVSFTVGSGEVFGFLGPNGAGKTTTVRTLGTLLHPTSGSAVVAGIPLLPENGQEIRQRIAIMPENPGLYLRLSVRENLELFAGLFGVTDKRTRIAEALEAVNLLSRQDDLCGSLSKGLRQRVGLARALLSSPEVLFLDEPTSGLDPVATREVHGLIDDLRQRGVTVFLTTHRLEEAERLCDRVAILNTTLRLVGRPADLRATVFKGSLAVVTAKPLPSPATIFSNIDGVDGWTLDEAGQYVLSVGDPKAVAPAVTRALVAAGIDVQSISETRHTLEDVYLEIISDDVEAHPR